MKKLLPLLFLILTLQAFSQTETADKKAILSVLKSQENAWNQNDLEGFMQGYWKSDSLKFLRQQRSYKRMAKNIGRL